MASITSVTKTAKDAAYVAVGLGVLGFQKAQVQRQELVQRLERQELVQRLASSRTDWREQVKDARSEIGEQAKRLDTVVSTALAAVDTRLEPIEAKLPETARGLLTQARVQAHEVHAQLRDLLATLAA